MNVVEFAHLREVYVDSLVGMLAGPICRQVAELYKSVQYKHYLIEYVLSDLLNKDSTHFKAAHDQLLNSNARNLELLLPRALLAQHVLMNKSANGVPVITTLEFLTNLYKSIFQDLLDHLDLAYYRSLKCMKHVRKVVVHNIRCAIPSSVPLLESPPETPVVLNVRPIVDDDIAKLLANPQRDISMAPPAPLPISPREMPTAPTTASAASAASAASTSRTAVVVPPRTGGDAEESDEDAVELNEILRNNTSAEPTDDSIKEYRNTE